VEDVLQRRVVSYHSQLLFDPDRLVEIFLLDQPPELDSSTGGGEIPAARALANDSTTR
jgi:hypothetical protein